MIVTPKVSGKERLRGPDLAVYVKRSKGIPMEEAIMKADEAGLVIASNKRMSKALVARGEWQDISNVFSCWTGTMTAYGEPGRKLGKEIEYGDSETGVRYVFPVPEEQQGEKNVLLVAEHPNFRLVKDGNDRIVQATEIGIVEKFPTSTEGWFLGDAKYDIPQGNEASRRNRDARYLRRTDKRVGLAARGCAYWYSGYNRRYVVLSDAPSNTYGVAVEAASGGALLQVHEENGKLIVEGTPEQIAAAARLLEGLKTG